MGRSYWKFPEESEQETRRPDKKFGLDIWGKVGGKSLINLQTKVGAVAGWGLYDTQSSWGNFNHFGEKEQVNG